MRGAGKWIVAVTDDNQPLQALSIGSPLLTEYLTIAETHPTGFRAETLSSTPSSRP